MPDAFEPTGEVRRAQPGELFKRNGNIFQMGKGEPPTLGEYAIYRRVPCDPAALVERDCKLAFADLWLAFEELGECADNVDAYFRLEVRFQRRQYTPALASEMRALTKRMSNKEPQA